MAHTLPFHDSKPRIFVLTDITNEPDDAQSFCRYLTYSNQFDTEGIVPTTSTWLRDKVAPEALHDILDGYEQVITNLNAHAHPNNPYPSADHLRTLIKPGAPVYGMEAVGDDIPLSPGAHLLLQRLESPDPRPLWVLVWGGSNVLASVLYHIRAQPNASLLRSKLRVYTISDQDDTGAWMRQQWPEVFYICSVHGWNQYGSAAWMGISGDIRADRGGADRSMISAAWIKENIQIGPLGKKYPDVVYAMEGDTPTFLYMIQNGLGVPEQPSWGSWGGRYLPVNVSSKAPGGHFADCEDEVEGMDGERHKSNRATIWRWRNAFQSDFAARMQWTLTSEFAGANHAPVVRVDGYQGLGVMDVDVEAGKGVRFDASESYDPDGDELTFKWWQYREPSAVQTYHTWEVADLDIRPSSDWKSAEVFVPPPEKSCQVIRSNPPRLMDRGVPLHVILEVKDNGKPALTTYQRIIITPVNKSGRVES
jgi:hypothetical protein